MLHLLTSVRCFLFWVCSFIVMAAVGDLSAESLPFKNVAWKIPNFFDLPTEEGYRVDSPAFFFANAAWCLQLRPNGSEKNSSIDHIDLLLVRMDSCILEHRIYYRMGFKTRRGKEYKCYEDERTFNDVYDACGVARYLTQYTVRTQRHFLAPKGTVTVFCRMRVAEGTRLEAFSQAERPESSFLASLREASCPKEFESSCRAELREASSQTGVSGSPGQTEVQETSSQTEVPESSSGTEVQEVSAGVQKLQLDYKKLLQGEEESDVCLKVSDKEFRAHRCILRARSEVFNSMFKYDTEEKATGVVVIEDLEPDSFPEFLQHLYAGRVEAFSNENVFHLYSAADKYDVQELRSECLEYMRDTLSVDTFCDVVTLALRYQEKELLRLAVDFFSKNLSDIIVTVKWQILLRDHHVGANELLIKALAPGKR